MNYDPDEDPDDPGWFDTDWEPPDPHPSEYYPVRFALGFPMTMTDVEWWTSLRHVVVNFRSDQAWVSWESEPDPIMETEWATRIARLAISRPWAAAWEYVDWQTKQLFEPLWREGPVPVEPVEDDDDDDF